MAHPRLKHIESMAGTNDTSDRHAVLIGTPWETLGSIIPRGASVREMLQAAGLDWRVIRAKSYTEIDMDDLEGFTPETLPPGAIHDPFQGTVRLLNEKSFSLVRATDLAILSPFVGPRYKEIQNETAFEVFAEFIEAGQMTMETAGSLANGRHIWGLAKTGHGFELADGTRIESYFLLLQSHFYGYALKAMWTPIRFPGGGSLVQSINKKGVGGSVNQTYTMSHASKFDAKRIQEIKEVVGIAERSMEDFRGKAEFMARSAVSPEAGILYLINCFDTDLPGRCKVAGEDVPRTFAEIQGSSLANRNLKKVARMLDRTYRDGNGTAWGCWTAVQDAYDHELGHGESTRLENAWLGKNRDNKLQAFNLAEVLAASQGK